MNVRSRPGEEAASRTGEKVRTTVARRAIAPVVKIVELDKVRLVP